MCAYEYKCICCIEINKLRLDYVWKNSNIMKSITNSKQNHSHAKKKNREREKLRMKIFISRSIQVSSEESNTEKEYFQVLPIVSNRLYC